MTRQAFPVLTCDVAVAASAAERPTSLDGVATQELDSGHFAIITEGSLAGNLYWLDITSGAAPDGVNVIQPLDGPGRWLLWPL